MLVLLEGDFSDGWRGYESRWQQPGFVLPSYRQPRWDGSNLTGKTILLWAEQGLGDTIHFVRYAPLVKQRGGRVIVACQSALLRLLDGCEGIDALVAKEAPPPDFDVYSPLLSLPGILGTTLETAPADVPYLPADTTLVEHWRQQLETAIRSPGSGPIVGIAWQGNPTYRKDRQRSIPLECFEPLCRVPGIHLVNLQKGPGAEQIGAVARDWPLIDFGAKLDETSGPFRDTAAIMQSLDLVVTSDSAIAHLAGALAVPVWVAIPWMPDFRWLLDREDSPWYPTMRLFRQTTEGSWGDVFERIGAELCERMASRRSHAISE